MQKYINTFLKIIKYPVALLSALAFYPLLQALVKMIAQTFSQEIALYFLAPIVGVMVIWGIVPGLNGSALTIFAHEFTHMLAALLTFHKPKNMSIMPDKGGSFTYEGKGNWLCRPGPVRLQRRRGRRPGGKQEEGPAFRERDRSNVLLA